jgi:hypothetical protein
MALEEGVNSPVVVGREPFFEPGTLECLLEIVVVPVV